MHIGSVYKGNILCYHTCNYMMFANILSAGCIGFLFGALWYSFFSVEMLVAVIVSVVFGSGVALFFKFERVRNVCVALCFCCVGMVAFAGAEQNILTTELFGVGEEVEFRGRVVEVPDERADGRIFLVVQPEHARIQHKVRITLYAGSYKLGEDVRVAGLLREPEDFSGFEYRGWLAKQDIGYIMRGVTVEKLGTRSTSVGTVLSDARAELRKGITDSLPPYAASLYRAMVLGERGALDAQTQQNLQKAGLSHIVAISGMHIAILFFVVFFFVSAFPLSRARAGVIALFCIALYAFMVGGSASVVRACLMVGVFFLAERFGRPHSSLRVLLLVGALMVALNPLIIRYDIGFQLSFAAVFGIILALPLHDRLLSFVPEKLGLRSLVGVSLSAQAATLPLVLTHFGAFPVWGIISNILVVSILPIVLVAGIATALLGVVGLPSWVFGSSFLLAEYVRQIALWFS